MLLVVLFVLFIGAMLFAEEGFRMFGGGATSPGTLLQLVAKGPQDVYLTGYPSGGFGRLGYPHAQYGYPSRYYHGRKSPYWHSPYWAGWGLGWPYGQYGPGFGGYGHPGVRVYGGRHYPRYYHQSYPF